MKSKRKYSNNQITVFWRPNECIHASICFTRLYSVFNPGRRPWIVLDGADTDDVINIVNQCPTRALTFMWNDPEKNATETSRKAEKNVFAINNEFPDMKKEDEEETTIKIMRNGPLVLSGDFKLLDDDGCVVMPQQKMLSLCRCGYTKNPPYCDGNHFRHGFRDDENE